MGKDFKLVINYIKNYKTRSFAILFSFIIGVALIVGIGSLSRSAQQERLNSLKRETGSYHVRFRELSKEQVDMIREDKNIKDIKVTGTYAFTDIKEQLPINILYAEEGYVTKDTKLLKGRLPKGNNEVVVEEWIMTSLGLDLKTDQELTFKLYGKEKPETFKIVGILKDRTIEKKDGICEMFLAFKDNKASKFETYVTYDENTDISGNISKITKKVGLSKKENVRPNNMLIDSVGTNGTIDKETKDTIMLTIFFSGLVIYSIFNISIYQRVRDYGMLKAIGSTNSKIFKLIFEELMSIALCGIPIGALFGTVSAFIFNKIVGNIKIEGDIAETIFVIPWKIILISSVLVFILVLIICLLTYIKIRRISPIQGIRVQLNSDKNLKNKSKSTRRLSRYMYINQIISAKNIFRDKKAFIVIMLSMSLGGLMYIGQNYKYSYGEKAFADKYKNWYMNGDFIINVNNFQGNDLGLGKKEVKEMEDIDGIKSIKKSNELYSRIELEKKDILDMDYFNYENSVGYVKKVLNGLLVKNEKNNNYILKQEIKCADENMLKSLEESVVSGEINFEKMKKEKLAVVYIPHHRTKPVVDIKVGDTVKVQIPQGKFDMEEYWRLEVTPEYKDVEFKVGAIIDYPYFETGQYSADASISVILSDEQFAKITGNDTYNLIYLDIEKGADHKAINKKLGKIGSKVPGTTTRDIIEEKIADDKQDQKITLYNYGIMAVFFMIAMVNLFNNVSYNLVSRTNEFGMLRAVGTSTDEFKNMIIFEGLFYGILSSIVVSTLAVIYQIYLYKTWDYQGVGLKFTINYIDYLIVIASNILIGISATYTPAKKIKENSIVESINIID